MSVDFKYSNSFKDYCCYDDYLKTFFNYHIQVCVSIDTNNFLYCKRSPPGGLFRTGAMGAWI